MFRVGVGGSYSIGESMCGGGGLVYGRFSEVRARGVRLLDRDSSFVNSYYVNRRNRSYKAYYATLIYKAHAFNFLPDPGALNSCMHGNVWIHHGKHHGKCMDSCMEFIMGTEWVL